MRRRQSGQRCDFLYTKNCEGAGIRFLSTQRIFFPKDDYLGVLKSIASTCVGVCVSVGGYVGACSAAEGEGGGRVRAGPDF